MGNPRPSGEQIITLHLIDPPVGFMSTPTALQAWKRELETMARTMPESSAVRCAIAEVNRWLVGTDTNPLD